MHSKLLAIALAHLAWSPQLALARSAAERVRIVDAFFLARAPLVARLAHPSARYLGSRAQTRGSWTFLLLRYRSRWTSGIIRTTVSFKVDQRGEITRLDVDKDNAGVPAFAFASSVKSLAMDFIAAELRKKARQGRASALKILLLKQLQARIDRISAKDLCLALVRYRWLEVGMKSLWRSRRSATRRRLFWCAPTAWPAPA